MKKFFLAVAICCLLFVFLTSCKKTDNSVIKSPNVVNVQKIDEKKGTDTDEIENSSQTTETSTKAQDGSASKHTPADSKLGFTGMFVVGDELRLVALNGSESVFNVKRIDMEFEIRKELGVDKTSIGSIESYDVEATKGSANVNIFINNVKVSFPIDEKKRIPYRLIKKRNSNTYTFAKIQA
jgi:hypothetical protein